MMVLPEPLARSLNTVHHYKRCHYKQFLLYVQYNVSILNLYLYYILLCIHNV